MTLISLLVLIVGTAHAIGYLAPIHWVGAYSWAVTWFWLLAASILVPIGFVILGGCVVDWAKHYTSKNIRELEKMMKKSVGEAALKSTPASTKQEPMISRQIGRAHV